jgi:hypothetical protein
MEKTVQVKTESDTVKVAVITAQNKIVTQPIEKENLMTADENVDPKPGRQGNQRLNAHYHHDPSDETDKAISFINSQDFGWKADVCKLQRHHSQYGAHCDAKKAQTLAQLTVDQQMQENKKAKEFSPKSGKEFEAALEKAQSWAKKYKSADEIPDELIPESYDMRNIDGFDFTNPLRDQGACGSCYTTSFTQVIESRLKLKYGRKIPVLSPQFLMTCNYLNEGCEGGWSFFHGFLAQHGYMVSEKCAPYQAKTKDDHCSNYAHCKPVAKVNKSYFIGGAYGESSERKMMKELLRNGLVNGELNVPRIFSFY